MARCTTCFVIGREPSWTGKFTHLAICLWLVTALVESALASEPPSTSAITERSQSITNPYQRVSKPRPILPAEGSARIESFRGSTFQWTRERLDGDAEMITIVSMRQPSAVVAIKASSESDELTGRPEKSAIYQSTFDRPAKPGISRVKAPLVESKSEKIVNSLRHSIADSTESSEEDSANSTNEEMFDDDTSESESDDEVMVESDLEESDDTSAISDNEKRSVSARFSDADEALEDDGNEVDEGSDFIESADLNPNDDAPTVPENSSLHSSNEPISEMAQEVVEEQFDADSEEDRITEPGSLEIKDTQIKAVPVGECSQRLKPFYPWARFIGFRPAGRKPVDD